MIGQGKTKIILNCSAPKDKVTFFGVNPYYTNKFVVEQPYIEWAKSNTITDIEGYVCLNVEDLYAVIWQLFEDESEAKLFFNTYLESFKALIKYKDDLYLDSERCFPVFEYYAKKIDTLTTFPNLDLPKLDNNILKDHAIICGQYFESRLHSEYIKDFIEKQKSSYFKYKAFNEIVPCFNPPEFSYDSMLWYLNPIFDNILFYSNFRYIQHKFRSLR